jgi:hypothetical protein
MPKIHVLGAPNPNTPSVIDCVAHFAMVAGNNSAGVPWKTCYLASFGTGAPTSALPTSGNNNAAPGKIGNSELTQITSGDLIEIPFQVGLEPEDAANPNPKLNLLADRAIAQFQSDFAAKYKYFGYTVA